MEGLFGQMQMQKYAIQYAVYYNKIQYAYDADANAGAAKTHRLSNVAKKAPRRCEPVEKVWKSPYRPL